ncbi:hypothetical protein M0R45_036355 [Rubus argutus]|uniref:4-hydroxy-4-methyl-2-oxoglutarate aldolase n=1 Tax=Rubus argutus TaxID=59490 RepID=A0AAW1VVV5_RUBAR
MNRAIMGGMLAKCAEIMGWAGIVVNGCIRDVDEINKCEIGGESFGDLSGDETNERLYADSDGILVSTSQLSL